jgi:hypothetical protein
MSSQSLNPELTAKVLFLANLQRNLVRFYFRDRRKLMRFVQNQHAANEKVAEGNNMAATNIGQQQIMHPLLMPSLVCDASRSKIGFFSKSNRSDSTSCLFNIAIILVVIHRKNSPSSDSN